MFFNSFTIKIFWYFDVCNSNVILQCSKIIISQKSLMIGIKIIKSREQCWLYWTDCETKVAIFWDFSGIRVDRMVSLRVFWGNWFCFLEWMEQYSVHSALDSRMNGINRIRFTRNTQNKLLGGLSLHSNSVQQQNVTLHCHQTILSVSSQATSARTIPILEYMFCWKPSFLLFG